MRIRDIAYPIHKLVYLMDKIADGLLSAEKGLVTFSQFRLLMAISHQPALSQKSIAQFLGITEASVSRHIDLLEKKKLVTQKKDVTSRRRHLITLTPLGLREKNRTLAKLEREFSALFGVVSPPDINHFLATLTVLLSALDNRCPTPLLQQQSNQRKVLLK